MKLLIKSAVCAVEICSICTAPPRLCDCTCHKGDES